MRKILLSSSSFFVINALGYFMLSFFYQPFASYYKMLAYHHTHPYQYILLVSMTYGLLLYLLSCLLQKWKGLKLILLMTLFIIVWILISSLLGGILWKIHDMEAGFYPKGEMFYRDMLQAIQYGLGYGPFIVLRSFPYNIISVISFILITKKIYLGKTIWEKR